ncbi:LysE type translocator family protein [uncultured Alphaproteobacteria bacterium]|uniref:LysE type translocator family protein n=1 Tax=uncultured Alphaproteobacteria bacterium TaxID=91750 RepID=A0A212J919_9PROT|nr:LysE type translocator family protein [uncultured Alphaproteobacteria bacterium]
MPFETLAAMAAALAILAVTPGPGVLAVISRAIGHGFADAAAMVVGIVLGDLVFFTAALTGWAAVAHAFGDVFEIVRLVAAVALVAMGGRMIRASFRGAAHPPPPARTAVKRRAFAAGLLLTLGNPKAILFYLAFLPTFIDLGRVDAVGALEIGAVIVTVIGGVLLGYAALAAKAATCLSRPAFARWMLRGAGSLLIGTGAAVAARS